MNVPLHSLIESLDAATTETLETMFFAEAQPQASSEVIASALQSVVRFTGSATGWVRLDVAECQARVLSANFLGLDESEVDRGRMESVCAEMTNMICGSMLSRACPSANFELSSPEVVSADHPSGISDAHRYYTTTEGGSLHVTVQFDRPLDGR